MRYGRYSQYGHQWISNIFMFQKLNTFSTSALNVMSLNCAHLRFDILNNINLVDDSGCGNQTESKVIVMWQLWILNILCYDYEHTIFDRKVERSLTVALFYEKLLGCAIYMINEINDEVSI